MNTIKIFVDGTIERFKEICSKELEIFKDRLLGNNDNGEWPRDSYKSEVKIIDKDGKCLDCIYESVYRTIDIGQYRVPLYVEDKVFIDLINKLKDSMNKTIKDNPNVYISSYNMMPLENYNSVKVKVNIGNYNIYAILSVMFDLWNQENFLRIDSIYNYSLG